jgi:hypothetical protein
MKRALYDIWEDPSKHYHKWKLQLVNYIASFTSKESAERYAAAVQAERKRLGLK